MLEIIEDINLYLEKKDRASRYMLKNGCLYLCTAEGYKEGYTYLLLKRDVKCEDLSMLRMVLNFEFGE